MYLHVSCENKTSYISFIGDTLPKQKERVKPLSIRVNDLT